MISIDPAFLSIVLGSIVGLILALSGAGGGIIAVPLLVFGLHLPIQQAGPVGLLAVGIAAILGASLGFREGILRYRAASLIGIFGILTVPLGVWLAQKIPNQPLMLVFSLLLIWTAWQTIRKTLITGTAPSSVERHPCQIDPAIGRFAWNMPCARALAGTGMISGLLSGLLGVGGGFVIVPSLTRYSDLDTRSILATSMGVISLVALGGIFSASLQGSLPWHIAIPFGSGAAIGLLTGRLIAKKISGKRLQQCFAIVCLIAAGLMSLKSFGLVR